MIPAPIPSDEKERLLELQNLGILDTSPESSFDDLTKLASEICQTPIALVSLIDSERQWFKSKVGLDATETPRNISYCGHAIMGEEIFEIPDATVDLRFKDNPLCLSAPHVRFYAGVPLITKSGHKLGTLCVIDHAAKKLSDWQSKALKMLANQVVLLMEARKREMNLGEINLKLIENVAERKAAESQLLQKNIALDFILEGSGLGSWDWDLVSNKVTYDRRWCEMLGLDVATVSHDFSTWEKLIHPDDIELAKSEIIRHVHNEIDFYECTFRMKHVNGDWVWIIARAKLCEFDEKGTPLRLTGTHYNITAQKRNEQQLRDNQEKVVAIYEGSYDAIMMLSADGFFDCNKKTLDLFSLRSKEEFIKCHPADLSPKYQPDGSISKDMAQKHIKKAFETGVNQFEWTYCKSTGIEFPAEVLLAAFEHRGQKVLQATVRDISERKRLEAFSTDVQRMAQIGGWEFDLITKEIKWTEEIYRIYGLSSSKAVDLELEVAMACYPGAARTRIEHLTYEAATFAKPWDEEIEFLDVNLIKKWVRTIGKPVSNEEGKIVKIKGTFQDITERKMLAEKLEEQRRITQHQTKLASIGQLAAGVGHEINNPLAIIKGYLSALEDDLQSGHVNHDEFLRMLKKINNASDRIVNIVKGLRTFSRSDANQLGHFNFKDAVDETVNLLQEIYQKEGIIFAFHSDSKNLLNVYGNKGRIEQVIVNLLSNAKDATEGLEKRLIEISVEESSGRAKLTIKDNGKGIPDHIKEKIFDPFFTTKDVNKGTGIGLSILTSIIKEHDGEVYFTSEPGLGTSFIVEIPLCDSEKIEQKESTLELHSKTQFSDLSALVVEDEEDLRKILTHMLEQIGVKVTSAENGKVALMKFYQGNFDLLVTDLRMPEVNGLELCEVIRSQKVQKVPKIFIMTGGIDLSEADLEAINKTCEYRLSKPFDKDLLYKKIVELFPGFGWDQKMRTS